MTDPIVLIIRHRVREGMCDAFKTHYQHSIPLTKMNKPGTLIQLAYINNDATEVDILRIFPQAGAS